MKRFLSTALVLIALQGCSYHPVYPAYTEGSLRQKVGSTFMNMVIPSTSRLDGMSRKQALEQNWF